MRKTNDIFEKRLAKHMDELRWLYMELYDNEAMFVLEDLSDKIEECLLYMQEELEVIGNIYDNFKLLRGE